MSAILSGIFNRNPNRVQGMDPEEPETTCCKWLVAIIKSLWSSDKSSDPRLKLKDIKELTDTCNKELSQFWSLGNTAINKWVKSIYKVHGYNRSEVRGLHMGDIIAIREADNLLNPILLQKLNEIKGCSPAANYLYQRAKWTNKPLADLIFD